MKKFLSIIAMVVGLSAFAEDTYLYWMLNDEGFTGWTTMRMKAVTTSGSEYLAVYDYFDDGHKYSADSDTKDIQKGDYDDYVNECSTLEGLSADFYALIGNLTGITSFVVELWNGSSMVKSDTVAYSAAESYLQAGGPDAVPIAAPYTFTVPEPTSGMLVLIGGVLMALRRKRKIVA